MIVVCLTIISTSVGLAHVNEYAVDPIGDENDLATNVFANLVQRLTDKLASHEISALPVLNRSHLVDPQETTVDKLVHREYDVPTFPHVKLGTSALTRPRKIASRMTPTWHTDQADMAMTTLGFPAVTHLKKLGRHASLFAKKMPGIVAACTAFAIDTLGDITAQKLEMREAAGIGGFDQQRAIAMGCFSACFSAGVMVPFYDMLDQTFNQERKRDVVYKWSISNLAAVPIVILPSYFACTSFLSGENASVAMRRFRENYVETVKSSVALGVPTDLILFGAVPRHLRATVDNVFDYAWSMAVSMAGNRPSSSEKVTAIALTSTIRANMAIAVVICLIVSTSLIFIVPRWFSAIRASSNQPLLSYV